MNNKKQIFIGVAIVIFIVLAYFVGGTNKADNILTFELDFGNGSKKIFNNPISSGEKKVWSILQQTATIAKIDIGISEDFSIQRIDGQINGTDSKKWVLYVNGVKQESSPINIVVKSPDKVVFRFE